MEAEGVDDSAILDKALANDSAIVDESPEMEDPATVSEVAPSSAGDMENVAAPVPVVVDEPDEF